MFNSYKEHLWTIAAHIANCFEIVLFLLLLFYARLHISRFFKDYDYDYDYYTNERPSCSFRIELHYTYRLHLGVEPRYFYIIICIYMYASFWRR